MRTHEAGWREVVTKRGQGRERKRRKEMRL